MRSAHRFGPLTWGSAAAHEKLGNKEDAVRDYQEVLKLNPRVGDALAALQR